MATPGQLVQVMAGVLGISKATITQYDRVLAENGLRSKSGRGKSAARITSRDAANLLIAVAASPIFGSSAKEAVSNCKFYGSMPVVASRSKGNFSQFGLPILDRLPKQHSFADALSALIDAVGEEFGPPANRKHLLSAEMTLNVQLIGPDPSGQIIVDSKMGGDLVATLVYVGAMKGGRRGASIIFGDLRQTSNIGLSTISAIGSLITGGTEWKTELMSRRFTRVRSHDRRTTSRTLLSNWLRGQGCRNAKFGT